MERFGGHVEVTREAGDEVGNDPVKSERVSGCWVGEGCGKHYSVPFIEPAVDKLMVDQLQVQVRNYSKNHIYVDLCGTIVSVLPSLPAGCLCTHRLGLLKLWIKSTSTVLTLTLGVNSFRCLNLSFPSFA